MNRVDEQGAPHLKSGGPDHDCRNRVMRYEWI